MRLDSHFPIVFLHSALEAKGKKEMLKCFSLNKCKCERFSFLLKFPTSPILTTNSNMIKKKYCTGCPTLENFKIQIHFIPDAHTLPKWSPLKCHCTIQLLIPGVNDANCLLNLMSTLYGGTSLKIWLLHIFNYSAPINELQTPHLAFYSSGYCFKSCQSWMWES